MNYSSHSCTNRIATKIQEEDHDHEILGKSSSSKVTLIEKVPLHMTLEKCPPRPVPFHNASPLLDTTISSKSRRKLVRFTMDASIVLPNNEEKNNTLLWLSEDDCATLWYSAEELFMMREQVRCAVAEQTSEIGRGMELYGSKERLQYRWLTLQCIHSACRRSMSSERIAAISKQCSAGSVQVALLQALHDYVAVYPVPYNVLDLPPVSSILPTFPFVMRKRQRDSDNTTCGPDSVRRVQRKLNKTERLSLS